MAQKSLPALLLVLMAFAGCAGGDDTEDDDEGTPSTPVTQPTPPSGPRAAVTWNKDVQDNSFPEGDFTIQVNDTVVWTHRGNNPHSITSDDGDFDSHPNCPPICLLATQTYSHPFGAVGAFGYHCKVHPAMTGTVTVLQVADPVAAG